MRKILISILLFTFFNTSCSDSEVKIPFLPYPDQIAGFKRINKEGEKSLEIADYKKENVGDISFIVFLEKNADDESRRWTVACSEKPPFANRHWMLVKSELKDKSGKTVGAIRICRAKTIIQEAYYCEVRKDKLTIRMNYFTQYDGELKSTKTLSNQTDFLEFAKTILSTIDVDYDSRKIADTETVEKELYQNWITRQADAEAVNKEFYQAWKKKDKAKIAQISTGEVAENPILEHLPNLKYEVNGCFFNFDNEITHCHWTPPKRQGDKISLEIGFIGDRFKVIKIEEIVVGEDGGITRKNKMEK